jgi:hypothetical protein
MGKHIFSFRDHSNRYLRLGLSGHHVMMQDGLIAGLPEYKL